MYVFVKNHPAFHINSTVVYYIGIRIDTQSEPGMIPSKDNLYFIS